VLLYVPPGDQKYQLLVYWRDSYLLRLAGKIPREIVIFDTYRLRHAEGLRAQAAEQRSRPSSTPP